MTTTAASLGAPARLGLVPAGLATVDWLGWMAAATLGMLVVVAFIGPAIAPYDSDQQDLLARIVPPAGPPGDLSHVFGTDQLGRDVLSRMIVSTRLDLLIGFVTPIRPRRSGSRSGSSRGIAAAAPTRDHAACDIQMGFPGAM